MQDLFVKMIQRSDTTENWILHNPVLNSGEFGYDTVKKAFKIGDGVSKWNELSFYNEIIDGGDYASSEI